MIQDNCMIDLVERCNEYVELQNKLGKNISNGIFNIAKARKQNGAVYSTDDCRFEIDPSIYVVDDLMDLVDKKAIFIVSGLPPPALRKAQDDFIKAVETAIDLAKVARNIHEVIDFDDELLRASNSDVDSNIDSDT